MKSLAMKVLVKRLRPEGILPIRGTSASAGYDIYSAEQCIIKVGQRYPVPTAIAFAIPEGCYGRIAPRSGLALKKGIDVLAGVVDCDYRGEVFALLQNLGDEDMHVKYGDRVCQMIIEYVVPTVLQEVHDLPKTLRGAGGFGSTGVSLQDTAAVLQEFENVKPDFDIPHTQ